MGASAQLDLVIGVKDRASGPLGKIGGALGSVGKIGGAAFLGGAIAGVGLLGAALVGGIADARAANIVLAQTEAVLKSTGGASGKTAVQISELAASLSAASGKSLFGDDLIQQSSNLLLTFTNIKGPIVDAATAISVDMAQALGGAPADAAVQLGKALNDPIAGISALSRVGVTFSEDQKKVIAGLVETGDVAGAQTIILNELNKEFGGSAAAAAAADGGLTQFKDRMGELAESIGAQVLPMLNQLMAWLNSPEVQAGIERIIGGLVNGFTSIVTFVSGTLLPALAPFATWLAATLPVAITSASAAFTVISSIVTGQLLPALASIMTTLAPVVSFVSANLQPILAGLAAILVSVVVPAFIAWSVAAGTAAAATVVALAPVLLPLAAIGLAVAALRMAWEANFGGIQEKTAAFSSWFTGNAVPAMDAGNKAMATQATVLRAAWDRDWAALQTKVAGVQSWWTGTAVPAITAGIVVAVTKIAEMRAAWDTAFAAIRGFIETMSTAWNTAVGGISVAVGLAAGYIAAFAVSVGAKLSEAIAFFTALPGRITSAVGNLGTLLLSAGADVVNGMISGMTGAIPRLLSAVGGMMGDALAAAKAAILAKSPSKKFADEVGKPMMDGVIVGIDDNKGRVNQAARTAMIESVNAATEAVHKGRPQLHQATKALVTDTLMEWQRLRDAQWAAMSSPFVPTLTGGLQLNQLDGVNNWAKASAKEFKATFTGELDQHGLDGMDMFGGKHQLDGVNNWAKVAAKEFSYAFTGGLDPRLAQLDLLSAGATGALKHGSEAGEIYGQAFVNGFLPLVSNLEPYADAAKGAAKEFSYAFTSGLAENLTMLDPLSAAATGALKHGSIAGGQYAKEFSYAFTSGLAENLTNLEPFANAAKGQSGLTGGAKIAGMASLDGIFSEATLVGDTVLEGVRTTLDAAATLAGSQGELTGWSFVAGWGNELTRLQPLSFETVTDYMQSVRQFGFAPAYKAGEDQSYLAGLATITSMGNGLVADLSPLTNAGAAMAQALLAGYGTPTLPAPSYSGASIPAGVSGNYGTTSTTNAPVTVNFNAPVDKQQATDGVLEAMRQVGL